MSCMELVKDLDLRQACVEYCYELQELVAAGIRFCVAGGFIRCFYEAKAAKRYVLDGPRVNEVKDMDLWFESMYDFCGAYRIFSSNSNWKETSKPGARRVFTFECAKRIVQLCLHRIGTPEFVIGGFDFTVCQAAYDFVLNNVVAGKSFEQDLMDRRLKINGNATDLDVSRLMRYDFYGYRMGEDAFMDIHGREINRIYPDRTDGN